MKSKNYKELISGALSKIDEALSTYYSKNGSIKNHGVTYTLSNRDGDARPYSEVELKKDESNSVIIDDLYDVQWFHRVSEVYANENPALGYGNDSNWETIFSMELLLCSKHNVDNQLGLINALQFAIRKGGGTLLRRIETNMDSISRREFGDNLYHIETQMVLATYEIKRNLNFNCLYLC